MSAKVAASLKRIQVPGNPVEQYFINDIEVDQGTYLRVYRSAEILDCFATRGSIRRRIKSYVHTCEARGVQANLVPKPAEVHEPVEPSESE